MRIGTAEHRRLSFVIAAAVGLGFYIAQFEVRSPIVDTNYHLDDMLTELESVNQQVSSSVSEVIRMGGVIHK